MLTVAMNFTRESVLQVPELLEKAFIKLDKMGEIKYVSPDNEPDVVVNSMPWAGVRSGTRATVYWELDIAETNHVGDYGNFDIVYFPSRMREEIWRSQDKWLPMAVDFDYYHPIEKDLDLDVCFMGRFDRSLRMEYTDRLSKKFNVFAGGARRGIETCEQLCRAKCSYQISEFENLEQRNFEYSAVLPMVLERVKDIDVVFKENEHFKGFDRNNYQEFEDKINWCINNYYEAIQMRDRMILHLKQNHTYIHRAKQILEDICSL